MDKKTGVRSGPPPPAEVKGSTARVNVIDYSKEVVSVVGIVTEKTRITLPEYRELMKIKEPPLTNCHVTLEIKGVATAVANAIRRVPIDELKHHALYIHAYRAENEEKRIQEDPFMNEQVLSQRIKNIPLRPRIPDNIVKNARFRLMIENKSDSTKTVMSGDISVVDGIQKSGTASEKILFNPTAELAFIQPGYCIYVHDIRIREGYGKIDGVFRAACLGRLKHLDIPEAPAKETHPRGAPRADESGYLVSTLVADPRHHQIGFTIPATGPDPEEAIGVIVASCANIIERLRAVLIGLKEVNAATVDAAPKRGEGIHFTLIEGDISEGILWVSAETHTIGNLIKRMIFELKPSIVFVDYTCIQHENGIRVTIKDRSDVVKLARDGVQRGIDIIEKIKSGVESAPRKEISEEVGESKSKK